MQQTESGNSDFLLVLCRSLCINVTSDVKINMFLSVQLQLVVSFNHKASKITDKAPESTDIYIYINIWVVTICPTVLI